MLTNHPAFYIFGENTNVGKTLFARALCFAATQKKIKTHYIKPIQTGYCADNNADNDSYIISQDINKSLCKTTTLLSMAQAVSPHRAQFLEDNLSAAEAEKDVLSKLGECLIQTDIGFTVVEGSGGVASPTPSGALQCDFYRTLKLPVILIGNGALGGISSTIAAAELLKSRGYTVACILLQRGTQENGDFLRQQYKSQFPIYDVCDINTDSFYDWFTKEQTTFEDIFTHLQNFYTAQFTQIEDDIQFAKEHIWWPFTQHQNLPSPKYIESAYGDYFYTYSTPAATTTDINILKHAAPRREERPRFSTGQAVHYAVGGTQTTPQRSICMFQYDGSASWWTQGLGHGHPRLVSALSHAAGRYGHVMFPGHIHTPAIQLTRLLLEHVATPAQSRVFFSDNGSTALEVALKMAFRARFKSPPQDSSAKTALVLGLKDSYHGDTIGAMNATSPNIFKEGDYWYTPRGIWLDYPKVYLKNGEYIIGGVAQKNIKNISDVFCSTRKTSPLAQIYQSQIDDLFISLGDTLSQIGACVLEVVVQGSGGMQFVDPLFQAVLVQKCKDNGIPVIFDEVFTGLGRIGARTAASLFNMEPDISCFGKLLSGGMLPLALTIATEEIFKSFLGDSLGSALLHGHSYTANPVACAAAVEALILLQNTDYWKNKNYCPWDTERVIGISCMKNISRAYALGTLFVCELEDSNSAGYASQKAKQAIAGLKQQGIDARALGNVIYLIAGFETPQKDLNKMLDIVIENLFV